MPESKGRRKVKLLELNDCRYGLDHKITGIIRRHIADRTVRIKVVQALIESYRNTAGLSPSPSQLERLADYILQEELKDPDTYKMSRNEQPFMSVWQYELRLRRETSLKIAEEIGSDGKRYAPPKRRKLSKYEMLFLDERAKIRNKERAMQYRKDTEPGPVITYLLYNPTGIRNESVQALAILEKK